MNLLRFDSKNRRANALGEKPVAGLPTEMVWIAKKTFLHLDLAPTDNSLCNDPKTLASLTIEGHGGGSCSNLYEVAKTISFRLLSHVEFAPPYNSSFSYIKRNRR
jgi:hypothetical protein